jgi:PilZ domain
MQGQLHQLAKRCQRIHMTERDPRRVTAPSQRPRNPRVPVEFALSVRGETPAGEPFEVAAQAIKISRAGATILLDAEVAVGSQVKLMPPFGQELDAEVNGVWTDPLDGKRRIGVKLLDEDGWFAE